MEKKKITLREATYKLKAEALRRYRLRHENDPELEFSKKARPLSSENTDKKQQIEVREEDTLHEGLNGSESEEDYYAAMGVKDTCLEMESERSMDKNASGKDDLSVGELSITGVHCVIEDGILPMDLIKVEKSTDLCMVKSENDSSDFSTDNHGTNDEKFTPSTADVKKVQMKEFEPKVMSSDDVIDEEIRVETSGNEKSSLLSTATQGTILLRKGEEKMGYKPDNSIEVKVDSEPCPLSNSTLKSQKGFSSTSTEGADSIASTVKSGHYASPVAAAVAEVGPSGNGKDVSTVPYRDIESSEEGQGDNTPAKEAPSEEQKEAPMEEQKESPIEEQKEAPKEEQKQEEGEGPVEPPIDVKQEEKKEDNVEEQKPSGEKEETQAPKEEEQKESKPEGGQEKEADKTDESAKQESPEAGQESVKAPDQTEQDKAPEGQEPEKAPEGQEQKEAPEGQEQEKAPEGKEAEKAPEGQEQEKAPEGQETEKAPPEGQEAEKAPEGQEQEKAPVAGQEAQKEQEGEQKVEGEEKEEEGEEKAEKEGQEKDEGQKEDENQNAADDDEEKKAEKKEEKKMPTDFYYNYEDMVSRANVTENSGLPGDLLSLQHSFGYDCTKRANLHLLDDNTLCFAAGNLVVLLDINTKEQRYIRSTSGGGIGAIGVHPSRKYFAVAEKGKGPNINIFEYPSLKLYRILRGGTEKSYSYVDFNPKGDLLASMGGDPDYMLTVWDWSEEQTVLRSKAFSQDVFRVTFSTELEGQLTTAGTGHIRFWKMADTFTGLKLQGELGKFGKTEISDIEGYVELPDGKVLSGTESGNMLLWDGGLIKVEIGRKGRKSCHHGSIQQILLDEGELMTVGADGYIRVWDFESVDTADVADESGLFEMEPMNELKVGQDVSLKCIIKSVDTESEVTFWYAQDANGGIWRLDLSFSHTSQAPEKLFTYHAGAITGCDVSPLSHLVATTGNDHTVRVYDYIQRKQLCEHKFVDAGTCLIWAPRTVDPKATTVLAGFSDGVVRVFNVGKAPDDQNKKVKHDVDLDLKQAFKPHTKKVTTMAINDKGEILATGGDDNTIFFMSIGQTYEPIGFINTPTAIRQVQWSPSKFKKSTLLVICEEGKVMEIDSPDDAKFDTSKTYHITGLPMRTYTFKSIKSRLRHEEELERKRIEEEERKKREAEERRKRIERGLETESEHGDEPGKSRTPEAEWKPYIPEEPSPILTGFYSEEGKFWLSMGEFDAGYLYECKFTSDEEHERIPEELRDEPLQAIPVVDSHDIPIRFIQYSTNGRQAVLGLEDGSIRIQNLENEFELASLGPYWNMTFHDNNYGYITNLRTSFDDHMMLSVGGDGNFFLYDVMDQEKVDQKVAEAKAKLPSAKKADEKVIGDDIEDPNAYSIEDAKQKAEHDKMMKIAEEKKREVRRQIAKLRRQFKNILEQNEGLPHHLQLHKDEFELDREIKGELERQKTERIDVVRKELAWEAEKQRIALEKLRKRYKDVVECERIVVKAFKTPHEVASFRAAKLSDDFYHMKAEYERRKTMTMIRDDVTRDPTRDLMAGQQKAAGETAAVSGKPGDAPGSKVTTTLKGSMGERINKALVKVEEKKKKRAARKAQWAELYDTKPDDDYEDPADVAAIKEAKDNMGDYKLKTAKDYVVPDHLRMNVEKARGRLLVLKDLIHEYKYNFNLRLLKLRDVKINVIEEIRDLVSQLHETQTKLDAGKHKSIPPVPEMHPEEMPEKVLEYTRDTLIAFKKDMETKGKKGASSFGGFGGFGGGEAPTKTASPVPKASTHPSQATRTGEDGEEDLVDEELSPLEIQLKEEEEIRLVYDQDRLLTRIEELLTNFDAELRLLRHDKFRLDITMKNADLRQVTLFEEFVLLKEYEKREDVLASKVASKQQEKLDMQNKILEVQGKLDGKKKEIEKLQEREKVLYAQFQQSLGDNNKFAEYLTKVFKKRIKRAKKKTTEGDDPYIGCATTGWG
ncbi:hypothetical protein FSP39_020546 [Pinctada imbricata]|uniref:Cilia- and flagella-associated protein 44 n=1 Tax=Pinctada imbricata TaxID=66713 RepID=A0AA88YWH0_PINIB|nr:hypothetical protein FSP39_020546 [Pinctada imbricata]